MSFIRKSNLEFEQWDDYNQAIMELIKDGTYQEMVNIHAKMLPRGRGMFHRMHGSSIGELGFRRFLPWHRAYLLKFEAELRRVDSSLSIPYWDWERDDEQIRGFENIRGLSNGRRIDGIPLFQRNTFLRVGELDDLVKIADYYRFAQRLEGGAHNRGHVWIGGDMATMASPRDPIFWSHHAMVDKLWSEWQAISGNEDKVAKLEGVEAKLDPWENEFDINNINDISGLGEYSYTYEAAPFA